MEGISHEAFSLAGHLKLSKLIVFYDSNNITIEGSTALACSDDVKKRFQSYGWRVLETDAHDFDQIEKAIRRAKREKEKPVLIISYSHIGKGSPNKEDTASAHGEPLGVDEVKASKASLGLPVDQDFFVPDNVRTMFESRKNSLDRKAKSWRRKFNKHCGANPEFAARWSSFWNDELPHDWNAVLPAFEAGAGVASRSASGTVLQALTTALPQLVGGSADLAPSNKTYINAATSVKPGSFDGKNLHFGIREHAMGAMLNGMALHGGLRVFGATFFVFADYLRPAIRLASLMKLPVIYVFTHDSFYVGEDGPTHEPVEHIASLRSMPGMTVIRPADATETGAAWAAALKNKNGPTALLFTRQNLTTLDRSEKYPAAANLEKGAYVLSQSGEGIPDLILIASGSELGIAIEAAGRLAGRCNVRVVSAPSLDLFEKQESAYKEQVLPSACTRRLAIEAGVSFGWDRYVGPAGKMLCLNRFGASAPYKVLAEKFGFTADNVRKMAEDLLNG